MPSIRIALVFLFSVLLAAPAQALDGARLGAAVAAEEEALSARIGVAVIDSGSGASWQYRGDELFPLNSTHKTFACAALLAQVDRGALTLEQAVPIRREMLVVHSPVVEQSIAAGSMTLGALCRAALVYSDNAASNVVVDALGGPSAVIAFMRSLGDATTRLDRGEPELNEATPGDVRDTTSPVAIVASLREVLLGEALSAASREQLAQWMRDDRVAAALLRSVLPPAWTIADKTGAGGHGSRSIIAVLWPPTGPALVVAIYVTQTAASLAATNRAIARIGSALLEASGH